MYCISCSFRPHSHFHRVIMQDNPTLKWTTIASPITAFPQLNLNHNMSANIRIKDNNRLLRNVVFGSCVRSSLTASNLGSECVMISTDPDALCIRIASLKARLQRIVGL